MYTDTVQTFVILVGAFILMGYGMALGRGEWGGAKVVGRRALNLGAGTLRISGTWVLGRALAQAPGPLTTLLFQLSTR